MFGLIARTMIRRSVRRVNAGDIGPQLASYADDAVLVFPGETSWSGEYRGKSEIERFLRRFVDAGLQLEPQEILVGGAPWNMSICVRFTDSARDATGAAVYENRGVIFVRARWGKIFRQELFEDTQAVAKFDEYLASRQGSERAPSAAP